MRQSQREHSGLIITSSHPDRIRLFLRVIGGVRGSNTLLPPRKTRWEPMKLLGTVVRPEKRERYINRGGEEQIPLISKGTRMWRTGADQGGPMGTSLTAVKKIVGNKPGPKQSWMMGGGVTHAARRISAKGGIRRCAGISSHASV